MRGFALSILLATVLVVLSIAEGDETKQVAVTFDDLPASNIATFEEQLRINKKILEILDKYEAEATGFVITSRLNGKTEILDLWSKKGHSLGNHTHTHMDLDEVDTDAFKWDIKKGISEIAKVLKQRTINSRYFRFPYFHEGNTPEKKEAIRKFLRENDYTIAPVTIHPRDSEYNNPFVKAWGYNDKRQQDSIKTIFVEQFKKKTKEAEDLSRRLLDRNIRHILLLHLNRLTAETLDQILKYHVDSGYEFISLEEALNDPAYSLKEEYVGSEELTWLERLNLSLHKK